MTDRTSPIDSSPTSSDPPVILRQGDILLAEEDRTTEFKAVQFTKRLIETVLKLAQEYINAFLNTDGGSIYFGYIILSLVPSLFLYCCRS